VHDHSNLAQGRIAAAHERFNLIGQCAPYLVSPVGICTLQLLPPAESL